MFLIALSAVFSYGIVLERIPEVISGAMLGLTDNLYSVMTLIAVLILIAGFFIDATVLSL